MGSRNRRLFNIYVRLSGGIFRCCCFMHEQFMKYIPGWHISLCIRFRDGQVNVSMKQNCKSEGNLCTLIRFWAQGIINYTK
jgi:hypothetical protein